MAKAATATTVPTPLWLDVNFFLVTEACLMNVCINYAEIFNHWTTSLYGTCFTIAVLPLLSDTFLLAFYKHQLASKMSSILFDLVVNPELVTVFPQPNLQTGRACL